MPVALYIGDVWTTAGNRPIKRLILNIYLIPQGEIIAYFDVQKDEDAREIYGHHFRQWIVVTRAKRSVDLEFMKAFGETYQGPLDGGNR